MDSSTEKQNTKTIFDTRLYFPKIGEKWGPSYEYPYPEATLNEFICLLSRGGNLDTFLYKEYALCSLIIKIIISNQYKDVTIFFSSKYQRRKVIKCFSKSVRFYHIAFGDWTATEMPTIIGHFEVDKFNEELLSMDNGFRCKFVVCSDSRVMRGIGGSEFNIIYDDISSFKSEIVRDIIQPLMICKDNSFCLQVITDDIATTKREKKPCTGGKSFTLKLKPISYCTIVCDSTCRSCLVAHDTWENEIDAKKKTLSILN
jgi:hypothetical protein